MANLTAQDFSPTAGLHATYSAVNSADVIASNDGKKRLHVKNSNASACVVTVTYVGKSRAGFPVANPTYTIPAGEEWFLGPFDPNEFNNSTNGVDVAYSVTASVTAAVLHG